MPVRVLVVDDSNFFRRQIEKLLSQDPNLEVVGSATNGQEAIEKALELLPDVVTMDIEMPVMNGIDATREIMRRRPMPIMMFSSLTTEGAKATLDALDAGAVDFIPKRFEDISRNKDEVQRILCAKVIDIAQHGKISLRKDISPTPQKAPQPSATISAPTTTPVASRSAERQSKTKLLAIGTSTGGPVALQEILTKLPADFPIPVILVQHMPATFTPAFANRLNQLCALNIKEAEHGDVLTPGNAYLAPGGKQMNIIKRGSQHVLDISESDPKLTYKPSVDVTFSSLALAYKDEVLGIILTGMGADGCEGAKKLKNAGSVLWAQDKESCVVYGMPAAVFDAGITDKVLTLKDFAPHIIKYF